MTRGQLILLQLANLATAGTGLVYAWMRYLAEPADGWAVVNHPWQPTTQHLHVLAAPLLVFAIGLVWNAHVLGKLRNGRRNRAVGVALALTFLPMAASGYLLQVAVDPAWRQRWIWCHVVASLVWVAAFALHQLQAKFAADRPQSGTELSAAARIGSQASPPVPGLSPSAAGGRQRRLTSRTSARPESRADSTSAGEGGLPMKRGRAAKATGSGSG